MQCMYKIADKISPGSRSQVGDEQTPSVPGKNYKASQQKIWVQRVESLEMILPPVEHVYNSSSLMC